MPSIARKSVAKDSPVSDKKVSKSTEKRLEKTTTKAPKQVKMITQFLRRFSKDTPGTLRFEAITKDGNVLQQAESEINQLYIRRTSPAMAGDPRFLKITVEVLDKLPGSTEDDE